MSKRAREEEGDGVRASKRPLLMSWFNDSLVNDLYLCFKGIDANGEQVQKHFYLSKLLLCAHSEFFRVFFRHSDMAKTHDKEGALVVEVTGAHMKWVERALKWVYDFDALSDLNATELLLLWEAADYFDMPDLVRAIISTYLARDIPIDVIFEHYSDDLCFVRSTPSLDPIFQKCCERVCEHLMETVDLPASAESPVRVFDEDGNGGDVSDAVLELPYAWFHRLVQRIQRVKTENDVLDMVVQWLDSNSWTHEEAFELLTLVRVPFLTKNFVDVFNAVARALPEITTEDIVVIDGIIGHAAAFHSMTYRTDDINVLNRWATANYMRMPALEDIQRTRYYDILASHRTPRHYTMEKPLSTTATFTFDLSHGVDQYALRNHHWNGITFRLFLGDDVFNRGLTLSCVVDAICGRSFHSFPGLYLSLDLDIQGVTGLWPSLRYGTLCGTPGQRDCIATHDCDRTTTSESLRAHVARRDSHVLDANVTLSFRRCDFPARYLTPILIAGDERAH